MALDAREVFIIGIIALLFSRYYLEKNYKKEEIFWLYSLLSVALGLLSAYTVIINHPSRGIYIPLTAVSIVLGIIYYQTDEEFESEEKPAPKSG